MDKIICLGKNYEDHIKEMKEGNFEKPVIFLKPPSVLKEIKDKGSIELPWHRGSIHHEIEVVFKLYKKNIIGVAVGLDLTLRDLQKELKTKGQPWEISKVFKNSALVTEFKAIRDFREWQSTPFQLKINGEVRQESSLDKAILGADAIIHYVDPFFPMSDGDIIFSGTPSGVGPLNKGDEIEMNWGPISVTFKLI